MIVVNSVFHYLATVATTKSSSPSSLNSIVVKHQSLSIKTGDSVVVRQSTIQPKHYSPKALFSPSIIQPKHHSAKAPFSKTGYPNRNTLFSPGELVIASGVPSCYSDYQIRSNAGWLKNTIIPLDKRCLRPLVFAHD